MKSWKIGELARRTGLTVRALHHYDHLGLVRPSARTASGHRLYGEGDLARLQQVASLRALGFPLGEIRALLGPGGIAALEVLGLHVDRLREEVRARERLLGRLEAARAALRSAGTVSAEELIRTIKETTMIEKHYTPEQLETLRQRREALGEAHVREVEAEWPRLMDAVRAEMDAGTDPAEPRVQALAARWRALVEEFTGGDPGIRQSLESVYREEESVQGMDVAAMRPLMEYVGRAWAAGAAG